MRNRIFKELPTTNLPVPSGTKSGDPVQVGGWNGVAATDRANRANFLSDPTGTTYGAAWGGANPDGWATVQVTGSFFLDVTAAAAPNIGDTLYYDPATKRLTTTAGTLKKWGIVGEGPSQTLPVNNGNGTFKCACAPFAVL